MARGIFNPEGEFLRELHKRKLEEETAESPKVTEEHGGEPPEEKEAWKKELERAEQQYETRIGKKPVKIETAEQVARYLGEEIEKTADERTWDKTRVYQGEHGPRGHRHGKKPAKPGRETVRQKEAA